MSVLIEQLEEAHAEGKITKEDLEMASVEIRKMEEDKEYAGVTNYNILNDGSDTISNSFLWKRTERGYKFWRELIDKIYL